MSTQMTEPIFRHDKNFQTYITQYAQANELAMAGPEWQAALLAAQRLDYIKDRNLTTHMILKPSEAQKEGLLRRVFGRFSRRSQQEIYLSELSDIRAFLNLAKGAAAQQSDLKWGPLRNGFATRMIGSLLPGGQQKGSRPTPARFDELPLWRTFYRRKLASGAKTLYVRGHLLHDRMGGVGIDFNLVLLTAATGGDFGANHANAAHRNLVEGPLLWAYRNMHGYNPTVTQINYEVMADYSRQPREGTTELSKIAQAYRQAAKRTSGKPIEKSGNGGAEPTHQYVMNELALNPPSPHLNDAMLAIEAQPWEQWRKVHQKIVENLQLWQSEDENVPRSLEITYSWVENGVTTRPRTVTIQIHLPNSLAARFK